MRQLLSYNHNFLNNLFQKSHNNHYLTVMNFNQNNSVTPFKISSLLQVKVIILLKIQSLHLPQINPVKVHKGRAKTLKK